MFGVAVMSLSSVAGLAEMLCDLPFLEPAQKSELRRFQESFSDPRTLAKELLQRGWLTAFQVNQLFQGKAEGLVLGPYLLLERLGRGGMGQVFMARHQVMKRVVALK